MKLLVLLSLAINITDALVSTCYYGVISNITSVPSLAVSSISCQSPLNDACMTQVTISSGLTAIVYSCTSSNFCSSGTCCYTNNCNYQGTPSKTFVTSCYYGAVSNIASTANVTPAIINCPTGVTDACVKVTTNIMGYSATSYTCTSNSSCSTGTCCYTNNCNNPNNSAFNSSNRNISLLLVSIMSILFF